MPEGTSLRKLIHTMSKKFEVPVLQFAYRGSDNAIVSIDNNVQFQLLTQTMKPLLLYCEVPERDVDMDGHQAEKANDAKGVGAGTKKRKKKHPSKDGRIGSKSSSKSKPDTVLTDTQAPPSDRKRSIVDAIQQRLGSHRHTPQSPDKDNLTALEEGAPQCTEVLYDPRKALFAAAREAAAQAALRQRKQAREAAAQATFKKRMQEAMQELGKVHTEIASGSGWITPKQEHKADDRIEIVSGQDPIRQPPSLDDTESTGACSESTGQPQPEESRWGWEREKALAATARTAAACAAADAASFAAVKCMQLRRITAIAMRNSTNR